MVCRLQKLLRISDLTFGSDIRLSGSFWDTENAYGLYM